MEIHHSQKTIKPRIELLFDDPAEAAVFAGSHFGPLDIRNYYWTKRVADLVAQPGRHIELLVTTPRLQRTAAKLLQFEIDTAPAVYPRNAHLPTGAAREHGYAIAHGLGRTINHFLTPDYSSTDY